MKILIVDDQSQLRHLMRMTLVPDGHQVLEAGDAAAAWTLVLAECPALVLLDIMLPGDTDGLELCRRLKADARTAAIKVVLVSARGHRNDVMIGRDAGADDYLLKPFAPLRLLELVDQIEAGA